MILIVGGAGYIGSHVNKVLNEKGYDTLILDNFSYGHQELVQWGEVVEGDLGDGELLDRIFQEYPITGVMHFAAFTYVGESVTHPAKYYHNNTSNTLNLLRSMIKNKVRNFIFSSTCAVYGFPEKIPLTEDHPLDPINPYGRSKLMVEQMLHDFSQAYDFNYISLRYFNAAGCDPEIETGEWHEPETHLIPLILDAARGIRDKVSIFGTDYPTPDGTCIRDYIHVLDLASAHIKAMEYLEKNNKSQIFNLGNGQGFSVREVIECCRKVTGKNIQAVDEDRRPGDPPVLLGSSKKAKELLDWKVEWVELEDIITSAWKWHEKLYQELKTR
ncbi:MAG: UDP-glucose 4-epimerase GalE [Euryarchaeota archaeon]|nr:UDP-glucose 4-epimerase GalE [Euryarchaeota archaeon]MBU4547667.1 UDP-glucose 4-epimerase GalE [Euryarchaeota archaeon]MBU4607792.1 UDP-glucose 4-epimerase GalE [Euryarchaeota archaeon]MBV1755171.1 UDP-glucose 4-epimerase GalE [Methanobacterium sp.]MBV1766903.1 UDP-glucose 4-epimerase GalE [Methanobacterium sp.]